MIGLRVLLLPGCHFDWMLQRIRSIWIWNIDFDTKMIKTTVTPVQNHFKCKSRTNSNLPFFPHFSRSMVWFTWLDVPNKYILYKSIDAQIRGDDYSFRYKFKSKTCTMTASNIRINYNDRLCLINIKINVSISFLAVNDFFFVNWQWLYAGFYLSSIRLLGCLILCLIEMGCCFDIKNKINCIWIEKKKEEDRNTFN